MVWDPSAELDDWIIRWGTAEVRTKIDLDIWNNKEDNKLEEARGDRLEPDSLISHVFFPRVFPCYLNGAGTSPLQFLSISTSHTVQLRGSQFGPRSLAKAVTLKSIRNELVQHGVGSLRVWQVDGDQMAICYTATGVVSEFEPQTSMVYPRFFTFAIFCQ